MRGRGQVHEYFNTRVESPGRARQHGRVVCDNRSEGRERRRGEGEGVEGALAECEQCTFGVRLDVIRCVLDFTRVGEREVDYGVAFCYPGGCVKVGCVSCYYEG